MWRKCNCGECEYCLEWKERQKKIQKKADHKYRASTNGIEQCKKYRRSEKFKAAQKRYFKSDKGKKMIKKSMEAYSKKYPLKRHVKMKFNDAVRNKKIKRESCQVCGSFAHAHHPDYLKPFTVNWMCPQHHTSLHLNELGFEPPTKTYGIGA